MKNSVFALAAVVCACLMPLRANAVVVNFDDLDYATDLTNSNYAGLTWEKGTAGHDNHAGFWSTGDITGSFPKSGSNNVLNGWGSPSIGIGFSKLVDVEGAYFAAQGDSESWTSQVRVHGYANGQEIAVTDWFKDIDAHPDWFQMGLHSVDRIVFESVDVSGGGGWYGFDDLTFEPVPEPTSLLALASGVFALGGIIRRRK